MQVIQALEASNQQHYVCTPCYHYTKHGSFCGGDEDLEKMLTF